MAYKNKKTIPKNGVMYLSFFLLIGKITDQLPLAVFEYNPKVVMQRLCKKYYFGYLGEPPRHEGAEYLVVD